MKTSLKTRLLTIRSNVFSYLFITREFLLDCLRYLRHARTFTSDPGNRKSLEATIIAHYHVLEKGLSMPNPSPGHSLDTARSLAALLKRWAAQGNQPSSQVDFAHGVLSAFTEFQHNHGVDVADLRTALAALHASAVASGENVYQLKQNAALKHNWTSFADFAMSRHSVRVYRPEAISDDDFEAAVRAAQHTPSVCNRQAFYVKRLIDAEQIRGALSYQNGNRGFGHQVPTLFVMGADIRAFGGRVERKQPLVDGALFAMSFIYALHGRDIGSCPLNWCVSHDNDRKLKQLLNIPDYIEIVMLLAAGYPDPAGKSPASNRHEIAEVIR